MNTASKDSNLDEALIGWTPLVRGGHKYKAHQLIVENEHKLTIKAAPFHFIVLSVFLGISMLFVLSNVFSLLRVINGDISAALFPLIGMALLA